MSEDPQHGMLTTRWLGVLILLAGGGLFFHLMGFFPAGWVAGLNALLVHAGMAGLIVAAAGGCAWPAVRRFAPADASTGLKVVTACALGLWGFSTLMLILGTLGVLTAWVWWVIVVAGLVLTGVQARHALEQWQFPKRHDGRALLWVVIAAAVGIWLAGTVRAPGRMGGPTGDAYDVLEYHLQLPREYLAAGHVHQTEHNVYGHYPLGVEMLFLLGMVLRNGAYEGMYLAKTLHGVFGVLMVAGAYFELRREDEARARFAAGLLATTPIFLYLSWLAMVELAAICYLAVALLWLRHWFAKADWRAGLCIGLMLGGACATKYLSVGFVLGPVLLVMAISAVRRPRRLAAVGLALAAALVLFSPWLIRNTIHTGNPVFPLMTHTFGRAHWTLECEQRWVAGHGPAHQPPVPEPDEWNPPERIGRVELFVNNFILSQVFGPITLLLALGAVAAMVADRESPGAWRSSLLGVAAVQLGVWTAVTHGMPSRFISPVMVPLSILAAGALARLSRLPSNPFRKNLAPPADGPWGRRPALILFGAGVVINLLIARAVFLYSSASRVDVPFPGEAITTEMSPYRHVAELPEGSRLLLVGSATPFYFPPDTLYATAFDDHPLARRVREGRSPEGVAAALRQGGVTHLWVNWREIARLAASYGYPAELGGRRIIADLKAGRRPGIDVIERMRAEGLVRVHAHVHADAEKGTRAETQPAATQPATQPTRNLARLPWITIYELTGE